MFPESYGLNAKSWDELLDEYETTNTQPRAVRPDLAALAERLQSTLERRDEPLPAPVAPAPR